MWSGYGPGSSDGCCSMAGVISCLTRTMEDLNTSDHLSLSISAECN